MLKQAIATCITIGSFATISSSNSSSILVELESQCNKINSINDKWNEPPQHKMKWDSQKPFKNFKPLNASKWNARLETFKWNEFEKRESKVGSLPLI